MAAGIHGRPVGGAPRRRRQALPSIAAWALTAALLGSTVGCSTEADDTPQGTSGSSTSPDTTPGSTGEDEGDAKNGAEDGEGGNSASGGNGEEEWAQETDATAPDNVKLPAAERVGVTDSTQDYFDTRTKTLKDPDAAVPDPDAPAAPPNFSGVTGAASEELEVTAIEYARNKWQVTGTSQVVAERVLSESKDPRSVTVLACVDHSQVRVLGPDGERVPNSRGSATRTLELLTLVRQDDTWLVSSQRAAATPDC